MAINIGQDPLLLIFISFLEILLILIPALIASLIEKTSVLEEIKTIGFKFRPIQWNTVFLKVITGIIIGGALFLSAGYIMFFYRNIIIETLFGSDFIQSGKISAINTNPPETEIFITFALIIIQFIIIGPCEEGFFRGFIIKKCEIKYKMTYFIVFSSVCFSFYHTPPFLVPFETIITFFGYYFIIGTVLSIVYVKFNHSLLVCSIAHSFFNVLIILI